MKIGRITIVLLGFLMLSGVFIVSGNASSFPKLPTNPVTLNITNNVNWEYPFQCLLSNVPPGNDVTNGLYTGWCIDLVHHTARATDLQVMLYSSLSPPAPWNTLPWDMINYVLNHQVGSGRDISQAIWYFVNENAWPTGAQLPGYTLPLPPSANALTMVNDALANGDNFVPGPGETVGVIVDPASPEGIPYELQDMVIELMIPAREPERGKVTGGGQCIVGEHKEIPSASFGFNAMWFSRDEFPKGEINYVDHTTGKHVHVHDLTYLEVWEPNPPNKPWPRLKAKFGGLDVYSGKMVDVYVEDAGEPGKRDKFLIFLDGEYLGGSGDYYGSTQISDPILAGNIQIHKPPK